jgi:hypothetical protein
MRFIDGSSGFPGEASTTKDTKITKKYNLTQRADSTKSEEMKSLRILRALRGEPKSPARLKQYWPDFRTKR